MTYRELFEQLLSKGYQPRPCGDHTEGTYCCARAVYDDRELADGDPARAEEMLRDFLELDRKAVFESWFGEPAHRTLAQPGWQLSLWMAQGMYADGLIDSCISYILQNP
jgi:hypothetical protein